MNGLSPRFGRAATRDMDDRASGSRTNAAPPSPSGSTSTAGIVWRNGQPVLQMQDAVVETVVTHTTRTTTSFAPISLPRLPDPDHLPIPTHLPAEIYPLATEPIPEDMKFFAMHIGGQRVIVQEDGTPAGPSQMLPLETGGAGWRRTMQSSGFRNEMPRVGLAGALSGMKGKEAVKDMRKRPLSFTRAGGPSTAPAPPVTGVRGQSPPRKRVRGLDETHPRDGALLSPLPSPEQEASSSSKAKQVSASSSPKPKQKPNVGSGNELAALFSLPTLITQFETLPDKLQQHVMMQFLRRSRMPTIQRLTSFAAIALKRDFITTLPHELAVQILRCVDTQTLARSTRVSQKWKRTIDSERAVWKQRLVDDGLWQGLGTEEEEEGLMRQRMEVLRWHGRIMPKGGTPSEEELMDMPSAGPYPTFPASMEPEMAIPLKHVYRRRYMAEQNWLNRTPTHRSFPGQGMNVVTCTQFDREKIITASDDHSINIYDIQQGSLKRRLDGHEGGVWALEYRGDTLVTGSTDRTVRVWDLETYEEVHTFHGHSSTVRCLQIVEPVLDEATGEYMPPYPMFVTGSRDSSLRVWKLPKKGEPRCNTYNEDGIEEILKPEDNPFHLHLLAGHSQAVRAIATYGRLCLSGSYDCTVRVWDIIKGTCLHVLTGHEARVYSLVYDRFRNRCASGSMDNTVKVWDVATGECLHTLSGHTALVGLLATSPNYLVSAAADASLRIWDANTDSLKHILGAHGGAITCFAHDETKVVSGSEGSIKLWDIRTGQYIRELVVGIQSVWQVVFKDNILVAATSRAGATVFEIFDFGELDDCSGLDDARLDGYAKPAWERDDPREPQAYQFDDDVGEIIQNGTGGMGYPYMAGGGGSAVRYHGSRFRNPSFDPIPTTQSGRIGPARLGASGGSARADRAIAGFPEAVLDPAGAAQLAQNLRFASDLTVLDANAQAGPSNHHQHQSGHRRSSQLSRQSDSPTPVGSSNGGRDMLRSLRGSRSSASGSGRGDVIEDDDEDGWPQGVDVEQDLYRQYLAPSDGIEEPEGGNPLDAYPEEDDEDEQMGKEDGLAECAERFENDPELEEEEEEVELEEERSSPLPGLGARGGGSGGLGNGQMFGWDTGVD